MLTLNSYEIKKKFYQMSAKREEFTNIASNIIKKIEEKIYYFK